MKIKKSCEDKVEAKPEFPAPKSIRPGTVFRYDNLGSGPYIKLHSGFVDLSSNLSFPEASFPLKFSNYVELKDAYLVTGEK